MTYRVNHTILDIWRSSDLSADQVGLLTEASAWYDKAVAHGGEDPALLNRKGIVAAMQKKYDLARQYFEKAGADNPDPVYLTNLAITQILCGEQDRGTAIFLQGMSRYSKNPYLLDQCSGFYFRIKKDYEYALSLSGQALSANLHRDPLILYHSYVIQKFLNRDRDAQTIHDLIVSIDPYFDFFSE